MHELREYEWLQLNQGSMLKTERPHLYLELIRRTAITAIFADDFFFEKVVLKGGNALTLALGLSGRTSLDLDFSIESDFADISEAERHLRAALETGFHRINLAVFDFSFGPRPTAPREGLNTRWGGYAAEFKLISEDRFQKIGSDHEAIRREALVIGPEQQRKFSIDLSKFEYTNGKLSRELDHFQIYVYAPEMIAVEKIRAICQQMPEYQHNRRRRPRARDFFDIHLILTKTQLQLSSTENKELVRNIFSAKEVPLHLLQLINHQREFHRPDWDSVRAAVPNTQLLDFDFYFDFVLERLSSIEPFGNEQSPL
jgi:predicted nucleotidyltransferase component of viral defense system